MIIHTDSTAYAAQILGRELDWQSPPPKFTDPGLNILIERLYQERITFSTTIENHDSWRYLFMVEKAALSQYDVVVDLCKQNVELPNGLLCLAGSGEKFHGLRNRNWAALPGNIHLTAHLTPNLKMAESGIGFTILAALSVVDTIDKIPGLKDQAKIKWVNDIFLGDAKVSGFLTHTTSMEGLVTAAAIGIGLNVESTPSLTPDRYITRATSLCESVPESGKCSQRIVFEHLTDSLRKNYERLSSGQLPYLLDRYKERSMIIGREVKIVSDPPDGSGGEVIRGKVVEIGQNLELYLEGRDVPITRGRLVLIT